MAQWEWRLSALAPEDLFAEAEACGISQLVAQILFNRGLTSAAAMQAFLAGKGDGESDPFLLRDMGRAVARLREALRKGELVGVYGDYDADGLTATALLVEVLIALGGQAVPYIPHRLDEGYGLHREALSRLRECGAGLVLTVDCGIGGAAEVGYAYGIGLDVVITDHHEVQGPLPQALAVVNPKRADSRYPFRELAGVGVAYKLAQALVHDVAPSRWPEIESRCLDLVALGTVADVVPMLGENRTLVRRGLQALNETGRPGLKELAEMAGLPLGRLDESHIGYGLGPRLNAAGRIDDAWIGYRLLVTDSHQEARDLARILEERNRRRQQLTEAGFQRARDLAAQQVPAKVLVVEDQTFAAGVVGLIAAKLVEEFNRPAVVLERGPGQSRGSARSIPAFDISAALAGCADLLDRYGGHPLAAGLALPTTKVPALHQRLLERAERDLADEDLRPTLAIDAELPVAAVGWEVHGALGLLPPFGLGNPEPVLLGRAARVRECRAVGRSGSHLRLLLEDGATQRAAVAFGRGDLAGRLPRLVDIAYTIAVNEWQGNRRLELRLRDLRPST